MSASGAETGRRESAALRRLSRLFRIERNGGFERWPPAIIERIVARRGALVAALVESELQRLPLAASTPPELAEALAALRQEAQRSLPCARRRLERIGNDLRLSRGEAFTTGIRVSTGGRTLGTS